MTTQPEEQTQLPVLPDVPNVKLATVDPTEPHAYGTPEPPRPLVAWPAPLRDMLAIPGLVSTDGDGSWERPVFGLSTLDPATSVHPFDACCKVCGAELPDPWRCCDQLVEGSRWLFRGYLPVTCCDACFATAKSGDAARLQRQRSEWAERCPVEFREDWDPRKADPKLLSRVLQYNPADGRGLIVHGPTSTGKTRAVWRLLKRLTEDDHDWLFIDAIDLLDGFPASATTVPLLVIDDLGNDALDAKKEARLLKLIRRRIDWHRSTVVTSQHNGDTLQKRFADTGTAQAIIRRLRESSDSVFAKPYVP